MSASQRVQVLTNQSNELAILAEFIKNPKLIEELTAEVKKLNSLTESEEQKFNEAKEFIQKHSDLLADLNNQRNALAADKLAHENKVAAFMNDTKNIRQLDVDLKAKDAIHSETEKRHSEDRKKIEEDRVKLARQNEQERASLGEVNAKNKKEKEFIESEKARLIEFEKSLKDKARAMAALVG